MYYCTSTVLCTITTSNNLEKFRFGYLDSTLLEYKYFVLSGKVRLIVILGSGLLQNLTRVVDRFTKDPCKVFPEFRRFSVVGRASTETRGESG